MKIGDLARIIISGEFGLVVGAQQVMGEEDKFFLRYMNNAGCAVQEWWPANALRAMATETNVVALRAVA